MANCIKQYKELLKGAWVLKGASYADGDIIGLWLRGFRYNDDDGVPHQASCSLGDKKKEFSYEVYVTADETGNCYLCINGNPNGFCSTFGKVTLTEDGSFLALSCKSSHFIFCKM